MKNRAIIDQFPLGLFNQNDLSEDIGDCIAILAKMPRVEREIIEIAEIIEYG